MYQRNFFSVWSFCKLLLILKINCVLGIKLPFKYDEIFIPEGPVKAMGEI